MRLLTGNSLINCCRLRIMRDSEFCRLVKQLRPVIAAVSLRLLEDRDEAEDNTQDTLLRLWTVRDRIGDEDSARALAIVVCRNLGISKLRRRKPGVVELTDDLQYLTERCAQWCMEEKENAEWLAETIDGLPAAQMTVLKMSQQEGLENSEIAEILGIEEVTVRSTLSKARKSLLAKLGKRK